MSVPERIISRLKRCQTLPSPPGIVLSLLKLTEDARASARTFSDLIEKDPALAAQILRIVNSPFYALRREITSLQHAVAQFGISGIRTLALSFALSKGLFNEGRHAKLVHRLRKRSVLAAAVARELASGVVPPMKEEVFLGALMQDIGTLALLEVLGDSYEKLLQANSEDHALLIAEEQHLLGTNHAEVGSWLLQQWGLPAVFQRMVGQSHRVSSEEEGLAQNCVTMSGPLAEVWLLSQPEEVTAEVVPRAAEVLGIDRQLVDEALKRAARSLPELARLFDVATDSDDFEAVLIQAHRVAFAVGLQGMAQSRDQERVLQSLAGEVAQLRTDSREDSLTGVGNRRFFEEAVEITYREANTKGMTFGLCFCDVDDFKSINDTLGHLEADVVLRAVADSIKEALRAGDLVARYGGDEFVVILRGCPEDTTYSVCRRLREIVAQRTRALVQGKGVTCAISIGFAVQAGKSPFKSSPEWVKTADGCLYIAKQRGKDQVVGYTRDLNLPEVQPIERSRDAAGSNLASDLRPNPEARSRP